MYETEIDVRLADVGETLQGRVYIHLDLSNADEPIKILAQAAAELPPLDADVNINYNNSSYDLELAIFTVSSAGLDGLTKVFPTLKAGSGGGGGGETLTRATSYSVGDAVTAVGAPGWATFVCTQAGTTAASEPSGYSRITKVGDKVLDGTAVFTARNIIGELDGVISSNASLGESAQTLDEKVAEMMSSTSLVMKLVSLVVFVIVDYATGLMAAAVEKKLSSEVGFKGIFKKVIIFSLVAVGHIIDAHIIGEGSVLRTAVIFFYLSNEGISILENAARTGLPIPGKLKAVLEQLREEKEN